MTATLKMVAEKAGVSIRTAGRALSGSGPVKSEVARKVLAAARELHYVPNIAARSLKQRSSRIVGVITGMAFGSEAGQRKVRFLEEALREAGRHTLLGALPGAPEELDELLRSWAGIVESVIFLAWYTGKSPDKLKAYPMRFLFIDCEIGSSEFDCIETDRASGVSTAVSELIAAGKRRIIRVGSLGAVGRKLGFERAIAAAPCSVESRQLQCGGLELENGFRAGDDIVAFQADAVFFDTDRMALGFYRYAHDHKLNIPETIAVAGFDNDSAGAFAIPALTTVAHPDAETVSKAVELILNPAEMPETIVYPTRLIRRESI